MLIIVGATFLGLSTTLRDLVGEREIFEHERDAGLSPIGYLSAKLAVFSCVVALQSAVFVSFLLLLRGAPEDPLRDEIRRPLRMGGGHGRDGLDRRGSGTGRRRASGDDRASDAADGAARDGAARHVWRIVPHRRPWPSRNA